MKVLETACTGCGLCARHCPLGAITIVGRKARIDEHRCGECGACYRAGVCKPGALQPAEELPWPRSLRSIFSNPLTEFKETGVTGRGTEEMKTNDVTGRYQLGVLGICIDVGRPCLGCTLKDVQEITTAVATLGVSFEPKNPITYLMDDVDRGTLRPEVLQETVVSAVVEFTVTEDKLKDVLKCLRELASKTSTVFSVGLISRVSADGRIPILDLLEREGWPAMRNCKINIGLGKATGRPELCA